MIKSIRSYFAGRRLKSQGKTKRSRKLKNFHESSDIGIIYLSDGESKYALIKKLVEHLKSEHGIPHVLALGFIPEKEAPFYHSHILSHDYFTTSDLDWTKIPKCASVTRFCEEQFDILIDLTKGEIPELRSVLLQSIARFKVGRNPEEAHYDLIFEMEENATLDVYIKRIDSFLTQLNRHEEQQPV